MGDVVGLVEPAPVALFAGDDEDIENGGHIPVDIDVGGVHRGEPVNDEVVLVKLRLKYFRSIFPDASLAFFHVGAVEGDLLAFSVGALDCDAVSGDLYAHGLGCEIAESHGSVLVDFW